MDTELIKEYIKRINPWWERKIDISWFKERKKYEEIKKFMKTKQIVSLTGLRRVGKTSIIKKVISDNIKEGFDPLKIFYFSFDDYSDLKILEILKLYEEIMEFNIGEENFIMAFDEIQKLENWNGQLKSLYDTYPNIKFIISGSESLFVKKKSKESLAGRLFEFKIETLSFSEFLEFQNIKINKIYLQKDLLQKQFTKYLETNGFPEILDADEEVIIKYIKEGVVERIIYKDMPEVFNIKDPGLMKSIFNIIYNDPGQIIEIQSLANELNVSRQLVSLYLEYLEESYLIRKLYNYSKNQRKIQRKLKKYYTTINNPLLIKKNFSKVFEQAIINELKGEFFWIDNYKNEVDLIITKPKVLGIEIKSGDIKKRNLKSLKAFKMKFNKDALIISRNINKTLEGFKIIPFYKYLINKKRET